LAGEVLIQAKRLWRFAETREWVANSCVEVLLRKDFDAKARKREVALRLDELVELWKVLGDSQQCRSDPVTVAALRILILTGQREREVTDAAWTEFDLDVGLWKIPASRTEPCSSCTSGSSSSRNPQGFEEADWQACACLRLAIAQRPADLPEEHKWRSRCLVQTRGIAERTGH
jgi:hypothetical protein